MPTPTKTPLVWVAKDSSIEFSHLTAAQREEILFCRFDEALHIIQQQKPWGYFVEMWQPQADLFLKWLASVDPDSPRILIYPNLVEKNIKEGINLWKASDILDRGFSSHQFNEVFTRLKQKRSEALTQRELRRELSLRKRQLEKLTESLEKIVEERTEHIQRSHQEESFKLQRERNLIRFIQDMAFQRNFEDFLQNLRREFKKFHQLGSPLLFFKNDDVTTVLAIENGSLTEHRLKTSLKFPLEIENNNKEFSQSLANLFGRPFVKTVLIPFAQMDAVLGFEHGLEDSELHLFQEMIVDRWPVLKMSLDRLKTENKLNLYSYRWEKTFDGIKDPVAILNKDYQVVRSNKKFADRLQGKKCFEIFAQRNLPCENCPMEKSLHEARPQTEHIVLNEKTFRVSSFPVRSENEEKPTTVIHQYQDVTLSRQLYLRLVQGEKMGALGALAGHLAHELNNPLTGIRSLSQVLLGESSLDATTRKDLSEIEKAAQRCQKIIKNLSDFVQEEKGEWTQVSLDHVIENTLPMIKTALRRHNLALDLGAEKARVEAIPQLLQQVVFNLLNNASQAMEKPGTISLHTRITSGFVEMTLDDEGPGIPSEIQNRIFEPFFTTKKEGHGTGLGLSLSKSIIERFGGSISFESHQGKGTKFTVRFPLHTSSDSL